MRKIFLFVAVLIGFVQVSAYANTVACPTNDRDLKLNVAGVTLDGSRLVALNEGAFVTLWSDAGIYFLETPFKMDNNESDAMGWTSLSLSESVISIKIDRLQGSSIAATVTYPGDTVNFYGCRLTN